VDPKSVFTTRTNTSSYCSSTGKGHAFFVFFNLAERGIGKKRRKGRLGGARDDVMMENWIRKWGQ
jgi:hypothetical protein